MLVGQVPVLGRVVERYHVFQMLAGLVILSQVQRCRTRYQMRGEYQPGIPGLLCQAQDLAGILLGGLQITTHQVKGTLGKQDLDQLRRITQGAAQFAGAGEGAVDLG